MKYEVEEEGKWAGKSTVNGDLIFGPLQNLIEEHCGGVYITVTISTTSYMQSSS